MQITMSLRNRGHLTCSRGYQPILIFAEYQLKTGLNLKESEGFPAYFSFPTCKMSILFITHFEIYGKSTI